MDAFVSKNIKIKSGYIFKGINGNEHISPYTIENYFTDYAASLGLEEGISFHTLRHSFATYCRRQNRNGHSLLRIHL